MTTFEITVKYRPYECVRFIADTEQFIYIVVAYKLYANRSVVYILKHQSEVIEAFEKELTTAEVYPNAN